MSDAVSTKGLEALELSLPFRDVKFENLNNVLRTLLTDVKKQH